MGWPSKETSSAVEEPLRKEKAGQQRQWVLRYKYGNHPAQTGIIMASSVEKAEEVGRAWCVRRGAGQMQSIRFIGVEDPILADESILEIAP